MDNSRVTVGYMIDGETEYLTDKNDVPLVFESQAEAELKMITDGIPAEDFQYLIFVEATAADKI